MISEYLIAVVWGILITLFLEIIGILLWFYTLHENPPTRKTAVKDENRSITPESVRVTSQGRLDAQVGGNETGADSASASNQRSTESPSRSVASERGGAPISSAVESCDWLNAIIDFVFHQLRDSPRLKKLMMKQINKEFTELLLTKSQGKMLESLSVREYDMGTSLPVFTNIALVRLEKDIDDDASPAIIEVELDVDYSGGYQLSIDADLVFNKTAFVSVQINRVKGRGRLQFATHPFTHWSFTFLSDPELDLSVTSEFEGRELSQLSSFLRLQFIRWVKRMHTLPNYKIRFKPFFVKVKPQDQLTDVHLHDSRLTRGELFVRIFDCNRLVLPDAAVELYCTASVGDMPIDLQIGVWQQMWPYKELTIERYYSSFENLGMMCKPFPLSDDGKKTEIIVTKVILESPSHYAGLREGDILKRVDGVNITNTTQVDKLIKNTRALKLVVIVRRPPSDIVSILQEKAAEFENKPKKKSNTRTRSKSPINPSRKLKGSTPPTLKPISSDPLENPSDIPPTQVKGVGGSGATSMATGMDYDDDEQHEGSDVSWDDLHGSLDISSLPNGPSGVRAKQGFKDRSISTPSVLETNEHRALGSSLEPPEMTITQSVSGGATANPVRSIEHSPYDDKTSDDTSMKASRDFALQSHDTRTVSVSRNPKWDEELKFPITSQSRYLNVCVWCRLQGSEYKSFMIGNVTIFLTDLVLECAASGVHKQRYVLLPGKDMKTSRMGLKALPSNAKLGVNNTVPEYVGDIYLSFVHEPMESPDIMAEPNESFSSTTVESFRNHPFTAKEETSPEKHTFVECRQFKELCYVCRKKLKKKGMQCSRCGIFAHVNKCLDYCRNVVICKKINRPISHRISESDQSWVNLDHTGNEHTGNERSSIEHTSNEHTSNEHASSKQTNKYTVTKQMITESDRKSEEPVLLSEDPLMDRTSLEESHITPPHSSDSEDEADHPSSKPTIHTEDVDGTDFVDIYTKDELECKIIEAQRHLVTIEENKRLLSEEDNSIEKDTLEYKLQKLEAQKETTVIKLKEYKDKLRQQD